MNVWAVAAVAALGAMLLVIVLCTGILCCDWRGRRRRRERKRAERSAAGGRGGRRSHDPEGAEGDGVLRGGGGGKGVEKKGGRPDLQIVVLAVSDETEGIDVSPACGEQTGAVPTICRWRTGGGGQCEHPRPMDGCR